MNIDPNDLEYRLSTAEEVPEVLSFVQAMGYGSRTMTSWVGLSMTAALALSQGRIVGAVPCEVRHILLGGVSRTVAHETVVAVQEEYRGCGIGSKLQKTLEQTPPAHVEFLSVFREKPESGAYRWYFKNGFRAVMHMSAYIEEVFQIKPLPPKGNLTLSWFECREAPWADIEILRQKNLPVGVSGCVDTNKRPLETWLAIHPYMSRYRFKILALHQGSVLVGYMVVGIGKLHSEGERIEIMETGCASFIEDGYSCMLDEVRVYAKQHAYVPLRWALSDGDWRIQLLQERGFTKNWAFDFLMKPLHNSSLEHHQVWDYRSIDFI